MKPGILSTTAAEIEGKGLGYKQPLRQGRGAGHFWLLRDHSTGPEGDPATNRTTASSATTQHATWGRARHRPGDPFFEVQNFETHYFRTTFPDPRQVRRHTGQQIPTTTGDRSVSSASSHHTTCVVADQGFGPLSFRSPGAGSVDSLFLAVRPASFSMFWASWRL